MQPDPSRLEQIREEAATWLAKLSSGEATSEDRKQFNQWVAQSPSHRETFFTLRKRWQHLNDALQHAARRRKTKHFQLLGLAASFVLISTLPFFFGYLENLWLADFVTAVGEQKTLTLFDGSRIIMNTDTAIAVTYEASQRHIKLLQGEAEFIVAHDPSRPFIVTTGNRDVIALGTEFSITGWNADLTVTVYENAVQILENSKLMATLKQGQQLTLDEKGKLKLNAKADLNEALAWRQGKLIFTAQPLNTVIETINRYRPGRLLLLAPRAAALPVSGIFDQQQVDALLPIIANEMHLTLARAGRFAVLY